MRLARSASTSDRSSSLLAPYSACYLRNPHAAKLSTNDTQMVTLWSKGTRRRLMKLSLSDQIGQQNLNEQAELRKML